MSGFPTGDLHPIYNVPMLGTHNAPLLDRLQPPNFEPTTFLPLRRQGSTFCKKLEIFP